ncbi:ScyD/ScyE family protein [Phycicoccus sonneratiae]|uniref:ScyD/ScyE family protein n=1 Tax=Phycicoccus sonneratiae TaxID=2807628 RepID=A0ABS2CRQ9_9MICO|nr:ScyD/ScyE family protein [Phycicoccus sonneraticus]MBM6402559.1 ScyD/ScyE family protein [Phycicoccus sonneraticus]
MTRPPRLLAALGTATALLLLLPPAGASAHRGHPKPPTPVVLADTLAAPFNLDISNGRVYLADGGLGVVGRLGRGGAVDPIATDQPGASGVARSRDGRRLAWTTTVTDPDTFENAESGLTISGPGSRMVHADTHAFEAARNPDGRYHYGVRNPSQCVADAFTAAGFPYDYMGGVDSHAYSVAAYDGAWVVADAGANALFSVSNSGRVRTLAVLPPQPLELTAEMVAALGLPSCVAGVTYSFEAVPTDVEVGRDGWLYVTTLPGGPESPVLGARGSVYKVNPHTGAVRRVATGFLGATNLALGKHGEIYVAELFAGQVSTVRHGKPVPYVSLPGVVAVESDWYGDLWAATLGNEDPPAPGTIVRITHGKVHHEATIRR